MNVIEFGIFCCWDNNILYINILIVFVLLILVLFGGRIVFDVICVCFFFVVDCFVGCDFFFGFVWVGYGCGEFFGGVFVMVSI